MASDREEWRRGVANQPTGVEGKRIYQRFINKYLLEINLNKYNFYSRQHYVCTKYWNFFFVIGIVELEFGPDNDSRIVFDC